MKRNGSDPGIEIAKLKRSKQKFEVLTLKIPTKLGKTGLNNYNINKS